MQRKKPYETIIDTKEVNLEKKIITRTITNFNSRKNNISSKYINNYISKHDNSSKRKMLFWMCTKRPT